MQMPTVGRSVHYLDPINGVAGATIPRAATVTAVSGEVVSLFVMRGRNVDAKPLTECLDGVQRGDSPGRWTWPPIAQPRSDGRLTGEQSMQEIEAHRLKTTPAPGELEMQRAAADPGGNQGEAAIEKLGGSER